ncbi:hypothetical protein [Mycoplasma feriruminatoris]|uniref:Membrane protein n=1 Tax=Mycoplasma feriruminatoris TaxID=1179777 RepID=A0A654IL72_9MOLU|nr:hypothetical protein [Mycoplasma feriruminatoris]WFQ91991.1 hypothetical protein MFERI14815_00607 [Mycoplasma feriruminatoris]WFQ92832.1 hypothetical protein MFERI14822_00624 [Mycoplasma feriruminatoris]WFQ94517.1 hypothetical protein MFERI15220_00598 [Mycoplasma feriruminatoris]WFQ95340.1 membrane protein [Mycoplasma feriruminatoris]VZR98171.1 hypothetical protein MF5295_00656 [Mycoplasma feriruminatoris]
MKKLTKEQGFNSKLFIIYKTDFKKTKTICFIMLVFLVISMFRLTLIGQFFDDIFFSFLFGWFKYLVYFLLFIINFCLFKKILIAFRVKQFIITSFFIMFLASFLTLNFIVYQFINNQTISNDFKIYALWQNDIILQITKFYNYHWYDKSIFLIDFKNWVNYFFNTSTYFNVYLMGGFISYLFCGVIWYITLPAAYLTLIVLIIIFLIWITTSDPFYLLKNKTNKNTNLTTNRANLNNRTIVNNSNKNKELVIFENKLDDNLEQPIYRNKEYNLITNLENIFLSSDFIDKMLFLKLEQTNFNKEEIFTKEQKTNITDQFKQNHKSGILTDSEISPFKRNKAVKKISDDEFFNELFEEK